MKNHRIRGLVGILAVAGFVGAIGVFGGLANKTVAESPPSTPAPKPAADASGSTLHAWPMFGRTPARNFVDPVDTGIPITWSAPPGREKNIKWSAQLGSKAYGGPIVSGGHIYVGTNNFVPREPEIKGDKGVLMCFNEADGKFLWQSVHDKLLAGRVNDWEYEGIASSPIVEGDRLWFCQQPLRVDLRQHERPRGRQPRRDRREVQQQDGRRHHLASRYDEIPRRISP